MRQINIEITADGVATPPARITGTQPVGGYNVTVIGAGLGMGLRRVGQHGDGALIPAFRGLLLPGFCDELHYESSWTMTTLTGRYYLRLLVGDRRDEVPVVPQVPLLTQSHFIGPVNLTGSLVSVYTPVPVDHLQVAVLAPQPATTALAFCPVVEPNLPGQTNMQFRLSLTGSPTVYEFSGFQTREIGIYHVGGSGTITAPISISGYV